MLRFSTTLSAIPALLLAGLLAGFTVACGSEPAPTATPPPATATTAPTATPTEEMPLEGHQPTAPLPATEEPGEEPRDTSQALYATYSPAREGEELTVILATTVLETGPQRVAFLLTTQTGLVKDSSVVFTPVYVPDNAAGEAITTRFNEWPYGTRGTFVAEVDFDRSGTWRLDIAAEGPDATGWAAYEFEVLEQSPVPALGAAAPAHREQDAARTGRSGPADHRLQPRRVALPSDSA